MDKVEGAGAGYIVGRGRPPKAHQFRKGQTGNPKGRPRKERPATMAEMIQRALDEELTVKKGGKMVRMTRREIAVERAVSDVVNGKKGAVKALNDLCSLPVMKLAIAEDDKRLTFRMDPDAILPALELLAREIEAGE